MNLSTTLNIFSRIWTQLPPHLLYKSTYHSTGTIAFTDTGLSFINPIPKTESNSCPHLHPPWDSQNHILKLRTVVNSCGHVWMWELDCEQSWVPKNWCFWTVVLEKTLESPLDFKEIQPIHPKGNLSWVFIGRTDVEAETPILWPPDGKDCLIRKDPDAGKDWGQEEKGTTEDEMVGWHHWLNGLEF